MFVLNTNVTDCIWSSASTIFGGKRLGTVNMSSIQNSLHPSSNTEALSRWHTIFSVALLQQNKSNDKSGAISEEYKS